MALVKYGGGIVQMSGSIAGNTFARNSSGNYVRARTKPVNPNSSGQQEVRNAIALLTTKWAQTLTAPQRVAWQLYASNVVMQNALGESTYHSGFNHYIRSNLAFQRQLGISQDAGPVIFELPALDPTFAITASEATQQVSITFDITQAWVNENGAGLLVYQGYPQNAQRNFFDGPWRSISGIWGSAAAPPASPYVMAVDFAIAQGQHQWCYARVRRADGRLSNKLRADIITAA